MISAEELGFYIVRMFKHEYVEQQMLRINLLGRRRKRKRSMDSVRRTERLLVEMEADGEKAEKKEVEIKIQLE